MKEKNINRIVWLEDQKSSIAGLTEYLQTQEDFNITIFEKNTDALNALIETPPDLFIVDLQLSDGDGLSIAKTARGMKPSIPIVTVTEYLGIFAPAIALSLAERTYPFATIYEKSQLESPEAKKVFATELRLLCQPEYHVGEVSRMEDDYSQVTLRTPKGDEYTRFFETEFLEACGINKAGEGIELVFLKMADGASGEVRMRLTKRDTEKDAVDEKLSEIISKVDLKKIREKFGSQVDDS